MKKSEIIKKIKLYTLVLKHLEHPPRDVHDEYEGICVYINYCIAKNSLEDIPRLSYNEEKNFITYPELLKYKPDKSTYPNAGDLLKMPYLRLYWWDLDKKGNDTRIKVVKQIIKDLKISVKTAAAV